MRKMGGRDSKRKEEFLFNGFGVFDFFVVLLFAAASPFAAAEEARASLETVTVYATRTPQRTFDVPMMVSKIDAENNALAGDLGDLLEFTPGVEVGGGPRRSGQAARIRGFDEDQIITLIDGNRQNFEGFHDGRYFIDPNLLKSVEVVKGASSAIYGGGGIGGVVAFETKDAADLLRPGETSGALSSLGYRTADNQFSPAFSAFALSEGWDLLAAAAYRNSGSIEQGNGKKLRSDNEMRSAMFKAGRTFNNFHTFKLRARLLKDDAEEPNNPTTDIDPVDNLRVDKEITDGQFGLEYAFFDPANKLLDLKLHAYHNRAEVEETDLEDARKGRIQSRKVKTNGFTADNKTLITVSESQKHNLSYGFEIYKDEQTGSNSKSADGGRGGVPNAEATSYGFYLQDEIDINADFGRLLLAPAARFDDYKSEDKQGRSQNKNRLSPKFSLTYKPTNEVMVFGSWAQAFRAPKLTEVYASGQHFPAVVANIRGRAVTVLPQNNFIPNPNLKPERVTTLEFGAGVDFADALLKGDRLTLKGSYYAGEGRDFIAQEINIRAGETRFYNVPRAEIFGFELEGGYELNPINIKTGLSYTEGEDERTGEYLSNNVPLTLVLDISYRDEEINSVFGWRSRFARKRDKFSDAEAEEYASLGGYAVHDFYYRWDPEDGALSALTLDAGIENIFDKAYQRRFAALYGEGRSYVVRVSHQW